MFYFRHDVWRRLCEPELAGLKGRMFVEMEREVAKGLLEGRALGFAGVRLLPKEMGVRPIMNLKRRGGGKVCGDEFP